MAGGVVQSDEWIVRREKQEEEFLGHVRFERGGDLTQADWALHRKNLDLWKARGNLYARRATPQGETWEVWGDEGEYDMKAGVGVVRGTGSPLRFHRAFSVEAGTASWRGTARTARWDGDGRRLTLDGGATVEGDDIAVRSQTAAYDQTARRGAFAGGRPVARFGDRKFQGACQADTLTLAEDPRRVNAEGRVRGWLVMKRE